MLFLCIAAPLCMMLAVFRGRSRAILGFLLAGVFLCFFAGEVNGLIRQSSDLTVHFLTVNITPIVEELLKAIPVVFFALVFKPDRQLLLECSVAVGVGFATLENVCLLAGSPGPLSFGLIAARGFGAGMMHGVSTLAVGYSMSFVNTDRKLTYSGTVAALSAAIIYHSIYNIIVQSRYPALGLLLPVLTYIPLILVMHHRKRPR